MGAAVAALAVGITGAGDGNGATDVATVLMPLMPPLVVGVSDSGCEHLAGVLTDCDFLATKPLLSSANRSAANC